tara:strand:+ start:908 stop:1342 length:435 start_codon:yes stop_codon:yes gene_type:complete
MSVYKIFNDNKVYIGSTRQKYVSKRIANHRYDHKINKYSCSAKLILEEGSWDWAIIETDIPVEKLSERERYYIENTQDCINHNLPGQTKEQWLQNYKQTQRCKDLRKITNAKNAEYKREWARKKYAEKKKDKLILLQAQIKDSK